MILANILISKYEMAYDALGVTVTLARTGCTKDKQTIFSTFSIRVPLGWGGGDAVYRYEDEYVFDIQFLTVSVVLECIQNNLTSRSSSLKYQSMRETGARAIQTAGIAETEGGYIIAKYNVVEKQSIV